MKNLTNNIAVIFSHVPHGNSSGREALDLVLSISEINQNIYLFFIEDGVFQLMKEQSPEFIFLRNYIATFKILPLLDVNKFYLCKESLIDRGLFSKCDFLLNVDIISLFKIRNKLEKCDLIFNF